MTTTSRISIEACTTLLAAVTQQPGLTIYEYASILEMCPHSVRKRMWMLQRSAKVASSNVPPAPKGALRWHPSGVMLGRRKRLETMPPLPVDLHPLSRSWTGVRVEPDMELETA